MALAQSNRNQVSTTQRSLLQLEVTGTYLSDPALMSTKFPLPSVLRAHNLPLLKNFVGKQRQFYVAVTYAARTWRTRSMRSVGQGVEWNENIDAL